MSILPELNDGEWGDWTEAFAYADGFTREDVVEIIALDEGQNDGDSWLLYGKLADGNYFFLSAWCDYTGWDCQAGGDSTMSHSKEDLERFSMSDKDRERLHIALPPVKGGATIEDFINEE